ncbi:hypothetical protein BHE74_00010000, partial [Ensete ventricosum]
VTWTTFGLRGGYDVLNSRIAGGLTAGGALHGAESYRRRPVFLKICSCWAAEVLLGHLQDGTARFELLQPPAALAATGVRFFARIGSSLYVFVPAEVLVFFWSSFGLMGENVLKSRRAEGLPATKKVEHYTVQKVKGDGRCMFRALVRFLLLFVLSKLCQQPIIVYIPEHEVSLLIVWQEVQKRKAEGSCQIVIQW